MKIALRRLCASIFLIGSTAFAADQSPIDEKKITGIISKVVNVPKSAKTTGSTTVYVKTLEGVEIPFVFEQLQDTDTTSSSTASLGAASAAASVASGAASASGGASASGAAGQSSTAAVNQQASVSGKPRIATIPTGKEYVAGQLVEGIPEPNSSNSTYVLKVVGSTISGTVIEVSPDKSWIIVRTQRNEDEKKSAVGDSKSTDGAPAKNSGSATDVADQNQKVRNNEGEARQFSPNINVSLQTSSKFEPIIAALRRGDGINATYRIIKIKETTTNSVEALEWQSALVGRLSRWLSLLLSAVFLLAIAFIITGKPSTLILGEDNRYSTSKFQVVLWFWLVISGYMAIVFHRMHAAGWDYIGGVDIPPNLLFLSGISVLSYAGAKVMTRSQIEEAAAKGEVIRTKADEPAVKNLVTTKGDRIDVGDYQMVVITILAIVVYAVSVVEFMEHIEFRRQVTMPDVDATLLAIFGLGQAAYLGKKYAGDTPSAHTLETALQATEVIASKAKIDADKADVAAKQAIAKAEEAKTAAGRADAAIAAKTKPEAMKEADAALTLATAARPAADAAMTAAKAAETKAKDASDFLAKFGKGENAAKFTKAFTDCQAELTRAMKSANDADAKVKQVETIAKNAKEKAEGMN